MVTHDVNLKFYCHRVLKVLDGKIIGEEKIDGGSRREYLDKLQAEIDKIEHHQESEQEYEQKHRN